MPSNYHTFLREIADTPPNRVFRGEFTEEEGRLLRDVAMSHLLLSILGVISLGMTVLAWSQLARKFQPPQLRHHVIIPESVWYPDYPQTSLNPFQDQPSFAARVGAIAKCDGSQDCSSTKAQNNNLVDNDFRSQAASENKSKLADNEHDDIIDGTNPQ
mmetsp:Transcript_32626/g.45556  ORF Transcript_32626/g.45556 Transcript_32626/m.45556 type:complete len:158 (-) Transcript_32626:111-584(-)